MYENSHKFFKNMDCKYYPCHQGLDELNCLFCYCPMYRFENCPGKPEYLERNGKRIKNCTNCTFPHKPEHYEKVIEFLKKQ